MNLSPHNSCCPDLLFANFNQDCKCFVVGTKRGFRIFNSDPLRVTDTYFDVDGQQSRAEEAVVANPKPPPEGKMNVVYAEMLFRCNYVAFVSANEPKQVKIWDDVRKRVASVVNVDGIVKAVKLRRDRIVIVMENEIKVFTFTNSPSCLHKFATQPNPRGLCSLSPSSTNSVLAFPHLHHLPPAGATGTVQIVDLASCEDKPPLIVSAHETRLSCITVSNPGTLVATASDKGTLIRIFCTESGTLLTELRRGTQPATIYSINFNADSSLLCASSSHGTIHIFAVSEAKKNKQTPLAKNPSLKGLIPKYFSSEWSFSRIEVPGGTPCICAFGSTPNSVIAVCADGSYHKFLLQETEKGSTTTTRDVYRMIFEVEKSHK